MKVVTIGRSSGNDVVIGDSYVSGNHCRITADDVGGFSIVDNSTNGTFVNGQRIAKQVPVQLSPGDTVVIGNTTLPWQSYFGISASDATAFNHSETQVNMPSTTTETIKQRHGFVTFWFWLGIVCSALLFLVHYYVITTPMTRIFVILEFVQMAVLVGVIISYMLLLQWKKIGFWLFVVIQLVTPISYIFAFHDLGAEVVFRIVLLPFIISVVAASILRGILQIKKNGISAWKLLESMEDY